MAKKENISLINHQLEINWDALLLQSLSLLSDLSVPCLWKWLLFDKILFSPVFFTVDKESKAPERKDASRSLLNHPAFWVLLVVAVISLILNAFLLKMLWENGILTLLWRGKDTPLPKLENSTGGRTAPKGL